MQQIIEFIIEIDKLKNVTRKTKPIGGDRYENPAEHSWQIALLAAAMQRYADAPVDIDRVILMLLLHDIGEIDTGDTIFYAEEGLADRKAAERGCVTRIFDNLEEPQRSQFLSLWDEFDHNTTPESRFAHACDRAMPVLLNLHNNGQSWRENGITLERIVSRVSPPIRQGCPALWDYIETRLEEEARKGWFVTTT